MKLDKLKLALATANDAIKELKADIRALKAAHKDALKAAKATKAAKVAKAKPAKKAVKKVAKKATKKVVVAPAA